MKKLIVLLAVAASFAAMAQGPEKGDGRRMMRRQGPMMGAQNEMSGLMFVMRSPKAAERLGLSEEQKEKLKKLNAGQGKDAGRALNEKVREGMKKQAELMKAEKVDEAAVMAAIDEVWEARKEIAKNQVRRIIAVKNLLTPEQIGKALEIMKERRAAGRNRQNRRGAQDASGEKKAGGTKAAPKAKKAAPKAKKTAPQPSAEG